MDGKKTDALCIKAYLSGDYKAFEKLYQRYERPLFSFILKYIRSRESAEDVFQQTWMKVINGLSNYEERGTFSSWLFGIAHNNCVDLARKKSRTQNDDFVSAEGMDKLRGEDLSPDKPLLKNEQREWLNNAMDRLPEDQKEVVLLRLHAEMPFKEIAELLGSPLNTVLGRMHYAVRNLRKLIKDDIGEDGDHVLSGI